MPRGSGRAAEAGLHTADRGRTGAADGAPGALADRKGLDVAGADAGTVASTSPNAAPPATSTSAPPGAATAAGLPATRGVLAAPVAVIPATAVE